ncbi:MAG: lytic murein transglycosylase [Pseudomonadales bacterium]|nr:lytic murein transglycosylase [Pseudomonadales bacterium]
MKLSAYLKKLLLTLLWSGLAFSAQAQQQPFSEWLQDLRTEALGLGISATTVDAALASVEAPLPRVIELDQSQPEFMQTFSAYMKSRITDGRIARGQALLMEHAELLGRIERQYGVPAHYLVAFWALESNFGDFTGGFSVINALATLAYDPRRSAFFRDELLTALKIADAGHISVDRMTGSWAGAMGQCQFMPSTFARYGVDGDGDRRIDIWNSLPDVFASAANFLSHSGWKADERWGREIILPSNFDFSLSGTNIRKSVTEWNRLGITRADGSSLGQADMPGSVILPAGAGGPAFLAYDNFRTTMVWNRSILYALSVGHLADRFAGAGPLVHMPASEEKALSRVEVLELQKILNDLGFDAGTPDGVLGSKTREAVRNYQAQNDLPTDGYASYDFLTTLRVIALSE